MGIEWNPLGIAGMITAIGGVLGVIVAALRQRATDKNSGTEQTLAGAFTLIDKLQGERDDFAREVTGLKTEVTELRTKQRELETELRLTKDEVYNLKQEISRFKDKT